MQVRRKQVEAAEQLHAQMAACNVSERPTPATMNYDSIGQFSQKVELYRGRCVQHNVANQSTKSQRRS